MRSRLLKHFSIAFLKASLFIASLLLLIASFGQSPALADDVEPSIVSENVASGELKQRLSDGNYVPISRKQWEQLQAVQNRASTIREVRYSAVMKGNTLKGSFEAQILRAKGDAGTVELNPLSFALTDLTWGDEADSVPEAKANAILGANANGGHVVLTHPESNVLTGNWALTGIAFDQSRTFQIDFPASSSTIFEIVTPANFSLQATVGVVSSDPVQNEKKIRWSIFAGNRTSMRLTISPSLSQRRKAVCFVEETVEVRYTGDATRVDAGFKIEAIDPGIAQLQFELGKSFQFDSVLYGDTRLKPVTRKVGNRVRLVVDLPEQLIGVSRTLTIEASAATRKPGNATVPWVKLVSARSNRGAAKIAFREETLRLRVDPPFVIESLKPTGFEQTAAVFSRDGRHTVTYSRRDDDAVLTAILGEQDAMLKPTIVEEIDTTQRPMTSTSEIQVLMTSGLKVFELSCDVREGWDIVQVTSGADETPLNALVVNQNGKRRVVRIELPRPVLPSEQRTFVVKTQRLPNQTSEQLSLPITHLAEFENAQHTVRVLHREDSVPTILTGSFVTVPNVPIEEATPGISVLTVQSDTRNAEGTIQLPRQRSVFDATASTTVTLVDHGLREELMLEIRPLERAVRTVDVSFSGSEPPTVWTFNGTRELSANVSQDGGRSVVRLELPQAVARTFRLESERVRVVPIEHVSVPFVRGAGDFEGVLRYQNNAGSAYRISENDDLVADADEQSARRFQTWSYRSPVECSLRSKNQTDRISVASATLTSILASSVDGFDQHVLQLRVDSGPDGVPLRVSFPNAPLDSQVRLNGISLSQPSSSEWTIPLPDDVDSNIFELRFRQQISSGLLWSHREPLIPEIVSHQIRDFRWNLTVRNQLQLGAIPDGFAPRNESLPPWTRYFGVLAGRDRMPSKVELVSSTMLDNLRVSVHERAVVQTAEWVLFAVTVVAGLMWRRRRSRSLPLFVALVLLGIACLLPDSLPSLAGTAFSGILIVLLIPSAFVRVVVSPTQVKKQTSSLTRAAGTIAVFLAMANVSYGQSDTDNAPSVIVPVLSAGESPIVYIDNGLYDRLQQRQVPHYATTQARYAIDVDDSGQSVVRISAKVVSTSLPLQVRLPIAWMNPGECLVNGVETQYLIATDHIVVDVSERPATETDASETPANETSKETGDSEDEDVDADERTSKKNNLTEHTIEVVVRPQVTRGVSGNMMEFDLIPSISTICRLSLPRPYTTVEGVFDDQQIKPRRTANVYSFQTGLQRVVRLRWSDDENAATTQQVVESEQACFVQLYRDFATIDLVERLAGGNLSAPLSWTIPPEFELASIVSTDATEVCRTTDRSGRTRVQLERQSTERITVSARLRIVWANSKPFELPAIDLHAGDSTVETKRRSVAVAAASGFTAYVAADQQLEQTSLPPELSAVVDRDPDHVYQLDQPTRIKFGISKNLGDASSRTTRLEQNIFVRNDEVVWTAVATIDAGSGSVFEHTLRIDPDVKIENVSLKTGQVSRLARWKQRGELLTLFLSQPTNDDEQIVVTGRLPFENNVRFPQFDVLNTITLESRIDVTHANDVRLDDPQINDPESLEFVTNDFETNSPDELPFARYRLTGSIQETVIHVHPLEKAKCDSCQLVDLDGDDVVVSTVVRITDSDISGQPFTLQLPADMSVDFESLKCNVGVQRIDEALNEFIVNSDRDAVSEILISLTARMKNDEVVEIPIPRLIGRVVAGDSYLGLSGKMQLDEQSESRQVSPTDFPDWTRLSQTENVNAWTGGDRWRVHSTEGEVVSRTGAALRIDRISNRRGDWLFGHSTIITDTRFTTTDLQWPASLQLLQLSIDRLPAEPQRSGDGRVTIPQKELNQANIIDVHWAARLPSQLWPRELWSRGRNIELPFPKLLTDKCLIQLSGFHDPILGIDGNAKLPTDHRSFAVAFAQQFESAWSGVKSEKRSVLQNELSTAYQLLATIGRNSGSESNGSKSMPLAQTFEQMGEEIGVELNGSNYNSEGRFFVLDADELSGKVTLRRSPGRIMAVVCLFLTLVVGWLASRVARAKAGSRVTTIESLIAIVAGVGCVVVLEATIAGSILIVIGLVAPTISKYFARLQPAITTDPIAIAPTIKQ